jgi:branched-chain amino acid transport system permease protein
MATAAATMPAAAPRRRVRGPAIAVIVVAVLAVAPAIDVRLPVVLPGVVSSPGSLQVLGIALVYAGVAMSYDIVFGYTGLLSLGHALFFAFGVYGTNLLMERAGMPFAVATAVAVAGITVAAAVLGAIALRVRGIAFAMVTLAFAEALSFFLITDPLDLTGGEEGLPVVGDKLPDLLRGVLNVRWLYWLALVYAVLVYVVARLAVGSHAGRAWRAIRDNEDRVELLGLVPYRFKLVAFVIGGTLAGLGGSVFLVLARGASPSVASAEFTLALLIMVVIGGAGRLWGAAAGGMVYGLLTLRLNSLGTSGLLDNLPAWIERTLADPLFVLGVLFIALVLYAPGGIASLVDRLRR